MDVLTAYEDGAATLSDPALLDRAHALQRVLFSQDDDLLSEAVKRQRDSLAFSGVIYAHQLQVPIGVCVRDLELIAKTGEREDLANTIQFLPL